MGLILDLILALIWDVWVALMQAIVPEKMANRTFRFFFKGIIFLFTFVCATSMFFGVIAMINPDEFIHKLGLYLFFIPLGISILQILIGLIVRSKTKK